MAFAQSGRNVAKADFDRHHLTEAIGPSLIFNRLHDTLNAYESQESLPHTDTEKHNTDLHG